MELPGTDGILRSQVFLGLWLAVATLFAGNIQPVLTVLQVRLQSPKLWYLLIN